MYWFTLWRQGCFPHFAPHSLNQPGSIDKPDLDKTTLTSNVHLYRFILVGFRFKHGSATFRRAIPLIPNTVRYWLDILCAYNLIPSSSSTSNNLKHHANVRDLLRKDTKTLRLKTCFPSQSPFAYLRRVPLPRRAHWASKTCGAVTKWKPLPTKNNLRVRSGLCNVYRHLVPKVAGIAHPSTPKFGNVQCVHLDQFPGEAKEYFEDVKRKLNYPPILSPSKPGKAYLIETDACDRYIGGRFLHSKVNQTVIALFGI